MDAATVSVCVCPVLSGSCAALHAVAPPEPADPVVPPLPAFPVEPALPVEPPRPVPLPALPVVPPLPVPPPLVPPAPVVSSSSSHAEPATAVDPISVKVRRMKSFRVSALFSTAILPVSQLRDGVQDAVLTSSGWAGANKPRETPDIARTY